MYLAILATMYVATALGITIGYHRLFTHRSFKTSRPVAAVLAALGSMAVEGPMLQWVATHRRHHQHSDDEADPHSPHTHGAGFRGVVRGMWHAHMGWLFASHTFVPTQGQGVPSPTRTGAVCEGSASGAHISLDEPDVPGVGRASGWSFRLCSEACSR